jgi:hypothetical protein
MDIFNKTWTCRYRIVCDDYPPGKRGKYKRWWKRQTHKFARRYLKYMLKKEVP